MSFSISILEKRKQNQSKTYIIDISYGGGIMQSKILFFDVDGTLLDTARGIPDIPQGALYQLKRIQEQGHKIFISSGRPKAMINQYLLNVGFDGYVLANGGYVEIDGQSIYEDRMDYKLCVKTVQMLEDLQCDYMLETADAIYIDPSYIFLDVLQDALLDLTLILHRAVQRVQRSVDAFQRPLFQKGTAKLDFVNFLAVVPVRP